MTSKSEIRTVILHCFERGLTTTQAKNEIAALKGTKWASFAIIKRWYKKFRAGDMNLKDKKIWTIFWSKFGVVHWELIPRGTGLNGGTLPNNTEQS